MALIDKLTKPFMNQCKQVINKGLKVLNNCKANNKKTGVAKQNACINKVYGQCMAMVTKAFINKVCTALSKVRSSSSSSTEKNYVFPENDGQRMELLQAVRSESCQCHSIQVLSNREVNWNRRKSCVMLPNLTFPF